MSITLINSALAALLLLGLVPLLVHLFARTRPPVYDFSSVEFLRRIVRKSMRLRKPQDYLLLALRTLFCLALIAAFLRPLLFSEKRIAGLGEQKNVIVVVDASASMGASEGSQTRFAEACAEASKVLDGLTPRDRANLIWMDADPDAVFPEMGVNFSYLHDALRRAQVSSERGAVARTLALAVDQLADTEGKREICVVSDFQKSAWAEAAADLPAGVDLVFLKVGDSDLANLSVHRLSWQPRLPIIGEEVTIVAEIENFSGSPETTTVFCSAGENRQSRNVTVGPWSRGSAVFRQKVKAAGGLPVTVSIAEDSFAGDDQRHQVVPVRPYYEVGIYRGTETETADLWRAAVEALPWSRAVDIGAADLAQAAGRLDVVLVAGWTGEALPGDGVRCVVLPGVGVKLADLSPAATTEDGAAPPLQLQDIELLRGALEGEAGRLSLSRVNDPLFELFADGEYGDPVAGRVMHRYNVPPMDDAAAHTLIEFGDGAPALVRLSATRYLWNVPLESSGEHWAAQVSFVPFFGEFLLHDRGDQSNAILEYEPGARLTYLAEEDLDPAEVELLRGDGEVLAVELNGSRQFSSEPASEPGLYSWRHRRAPVAMNPVNFPQAESDLRALPLGAVEGLASDGAAAAVANGAGVRFLRDGFQLWPTLLTIAVVLVFLELVTLLWTERTV